MGTVHAKSPEAAGTVVDLTSFKAKVQKININGLGRTKHDIVVNSVKPVFQADNFQNAVVEVHRARYKLKDLGCFGEISVFLDTYNGENADQDGLEVTFFVQEKGLVAGKVKTEIGNNEGLVGGQGFLRNIFGRGEALNVEYTKGTKQNTALNAKFLKPFHNDLDAGLNASVFKAVNNCLWSGYKETQRGGNLSYYFKPLKGQNVLTSLMYEGNWRHLSSQSKSTPFAVRENSGHSLKSSVIHETIMDKRDHPIFPTDGVYAKLKNEYAGVGGNIGFLKNEVELQVNVPIKSAVIQGSFQAGKMYPNPNKEYNISDLYTLGGPTSIRGFEAAGIGPHESGYALGDKAYYASALHLYTPLPFLEGPFSDRFRLHGFVNTGSIGTFDYKGNPQELMKSLSDQMRLSYGVGLALNVFGMARLELNYCIPYIWQKGDRSSAGMQMGISTSFL